MPSIDVAEFADSLVAAVYHQVRDDILLARLAPGALVFEADVARRFEVSKTPAREALRLLVGDGLLQVMPRRGYVVRPVGLDDLVEVFRLRLFLEPGLAADAANRATNDQADALEELVAGYVAEQDWQRQVQLAIQIHHDIALAAGNKRAVPIVDSLVFEAHRVWMSLSTSPPRAAYEHARGRYQDIATAVSDRDPDTASAAMRDMLTAAQRHLISIAGGMPLDHTNQSRSAGNP
ncbi:GntR family transcriptional regulator [Nonomuraea sp. NPDC049158]|uniref:GntR family transcriptional regulator n=1 Tax=Nonomuraea sp. NPDC049158 TaxID=3155649 RepID=UPI003401825F